MFFSHFVHMIWSPVTDYFISYVDMEVKAAKSAGKHDNGIKTLAGNSVEFVGKPRSFCFGGITGQNQSVEVYQVRVDRGMSFEAALELYRNEQGATQSGSSKIKAGFYLE